MSCPLLIHQRHIQIPRSPLIPEAAFFLRPVHPYGIIGFLDGNVQKIQLDVFLWIEPDFSFSRTGDRNDDACICHFSDQR